MACDDRKGVDPTRLRAIARATGAGAQSPVDAHVTRHRAGGARVVHEYRFDDGVQLFAKRYSAPTDAVAAYRVLRTLQRAGFGVDSRYRVPEPVRVFPKVSVVIVRAAGGECLASLLQTSASHSEGLRAAGEWLGRLHQAQVTVGPHYQRVDSLIRLARRATRAGDRHPELTDLVVDLLEELGRRSQSCPESGRLVPTHGRFHSGHVFLSHSAVTVIDLDRAAIADPASDLGEFLHRLRLPAVRKRSGVDAAETAARTFVEGYAATTGSAPRELAYWWSYSVLASLLRLLHSDSPRFESKTERYRAEFAVVPALVDALAAAGA